MISLSVLAQMISLYNFTAPPTMLPSGPTDPLSLSVLAHIHCAFRRSTVLRKTASGFRNREMSSFLGAFAPHFHLPAAYYYGLFLVLVVTTTTATPAATKAVTTGVMVGEESEGGLRVGFCRCWSCRLLLRCRL